MTDKKNILHIIPAAGKATRFGGIPKFLLPISTNNFLIKFHVDNIKAPLFVAQGANDQRVKQAESDQIVQALESKGIDVPYMLKENEGHGFYNEQNQFDFYREMENFLDKHLKE